MNDDFEQHLQYQPMRQVPSDWRAEILAAARDAQVVRQTPSVTPRSWLSTLNHQLSTIFWPHPKAWAGLAAVWVFIIGLNFSVQDKMPASGGMSLPASPEAVAELRQQKLLYAELIGAGGTLGPRDADRRKGFSPRPRSEFAEILSA